MSRQCKSCQAEDSTFDAEAAFAELSRKQTELAGILAEYMSQASLKRATRATNAKKLSKAVTATISGGFEAPPKTHPECCLVGHLDALGRFRWSCTGVLIDARAVLTAAHCCFHPKSGLIPNVVAFGARTISDPDIRDAKKVRVQGLPIIHPAYPPFEKINDIAILILREPAPPTPTPIASRAETTAANGVQVVGFGNSSPVPGVGFGTKRFVDLPIQLIRRKATDNFDQAELAFDFESDSEFVAGGDGRDACFGDSGGPAYIQLGNQRKVAGLVSRTIRGATCGAGSVYTRLDAHSEFIQQVLKANI